MQDAPLPEPELIPPPSQPSPEEIRAQQRILWVIVGAMLVLLVATLIFIYFLMLPTTDTAKIRDVFIIFMALVSLVLMITLVILIYQLSILINLLQNEIRPIVNSTNETVNTLRGTANFLSDNLTEPVIKLNEYLAGFQKLFTAFGAMMPGRPKNKPNNKGE
jgi:magnesium-transporting ATPase (P-type)